MSQGGPSGRREGMAHESHDATRSALDRDCLQWDLPEAVARVAPVGHVPAQLALLERDAPLAVLRIHRLDGLGRAAPERPSWHRR